METKTQITMRNQTSDSQLQENFKTVMVHITQVVKERKLILTAGEETVDHVEYITPKLDHLTQTSRKKLAKRLYFASKTKDMGKINSFFSFLKRKDIITEVVKVTYSEKELEIKAARAEFNKAKAAFKETLSKYKEVKGDFYKS